MVFGCSSGSSSQAVGLQLGVRRGRRRQEVVRRLVQIKTGELIEEGIR